MGPLGEFPLIDDLLMLLADVSLPIKVGWLLFFVWALAQFIWRRRVRLIVRTPLPLRTTMRTTAVNSGRRSPRPSTHRGGSPEFLAALGLQDPTPAGSADSTYRG